jgi:CRP-like cAMP-binding protein
LCKRLLDLEPSNTSAQRVLESISESRFNRSAGARNLYDSFFSRLSPSALIYFFRNSQFRAFNKDTTIAKEGEPANNMMMVVSGEIVPSIQGNRLKDQHDGSDIVLREGAIIGEMGLFSPGGTRTATLQASKNSITLTLDYRYLRTLENAPNAKENRERVEIQKRIWRNYCERTAANIVNFNLLFETLEPDQRSRLIDFDSYEFLPAEHGQELQLVVEDAWEYVTIVVAGGLTVYTKKDQAAFECKPDETLGLLRFVLSEDAECPFSQIEALPETYLIRFPYNIIRDLVSEPKNASFLDDCVKYGGREKRRFKLM